MDNKELITALHAQLKEAARGIFNQIKLSPGRYTASDLEKILKFSEHYSTYRRADKNALQERVNEASAAFDAVDDDYYREAAARLSKESPKYLNTQVVTAGREYTAALHSYNNAKAALQIVENAEQAVADYLEAVTVEAGAFRATFPAALTFARLADWEKEYKIKTADRAAFVKEEEGETIATCRVSFPKEVKNITDFVSDDAQRPIMQGVLLDAANGCIVASDTHILTRIPVNVADIEGEPMRIIIDAKAVKAVAGKRCTVKIFKESNNVAIVTDEGETYTTEIIRGNYPDYQRVFPKVSRDGLTQLSKEGVKTLAKFARACTKGLRPHQCPAIKIEIPAFSDQGGTATFFDVNTGTKKEVKFSLVGTPRVDVVFGISANVLATACKVWNDCLWYCDPARPLLFDNKGEFGEIDTIAMPTRIPSELADGLQPGKVQGESVECSGRHNYEIALAEARRAEEVRKEESKTISREEKEECAKRYCKTKSVDFVKLTDEDEIIGMSFTGDMIRYSGHFTRCGSDDFVLFDCKNSEYGYVEEEKEPAKELNEEVIAALCKAFEIFATLGSILEMIRKAEEIENIAAEAGIDTEAIPEAVNDIEPIEETPPETPKEATRTQTPSEPTSYIVAVRWKGEEARKRQNSVVKLCLADQLQESDKATFNESLTVDSDRGEGAFSRHCPSAIPTDGCNGISLNNESRANSPPAAFGNRKGKRWKEENK